MKTAMISFIIMMTLSVPVASRHGGSEITVDMRPSHSLRVIAFVTDGDFEQVTLKIEEVLDYGTRLKTTPEEGQLLVARLPGRDKPRNSSRIEVELLENIEVGATPSAYLVTGFRTIE